MVKQCPNIMWKFSHTDAREAFPADSRTKLGKIPLFPNQHPTEQTRAHDASHILQSFSLFCLSSLTRSRISSKQRSSPCSLAARSAARAALTSSVAGNTLAPLETPGLEPTTCSRIRSRLDRTPCTSSNVWVSWWKTPPIMLNFVPFTSFNLVTFDHLPLVHTAFKPDCWAVLLSRIGFHPQFIPDSVNIIPKLFSQLSLAVNKPLQIPDLKSRDARFVKQIKTNRNFHAKSYKKVAW